MYEIIWQVQTDLPAAARKSFHRGGPHLSGLSTYDEILDGFANPEVIDLGNELVIWQTCNGVLAAEGWRKVIE